MWSSENLIVNEFVPRRWQRDKKWFFVYSCTLGKGILRTPIREIKPFVVHHVGYLSLPSNCEVELCRQRDIKVTGWRCGIITLRYDNFVWHR